MAYFFELIQYIYSADFLHFMFSSVKYAFLFLAWIFLIMPAMLYTVRSYKPKDFLGYFSAVVYWCVCGFLVIISPFSLVLYFLYRRLYITCKKHLSSCKRSEDHSQRRRSEQEINRSEKRPSNPAKPGQETIYCMEAANGMTVRVPESKLEAWQAEQDRIKKDPAAAELTEAEKKLRDAILHDLYGKRHSSYKGSESHD